MVIFNPSGKEVNPLRERLTSFTCQSPPDSCRHCTRDLRPLKPKPSVRTIRRRFQAAGLNGIRPVKKPIISTKNRKVRVDWAKTYKFRTKKEWEDVFWSDESKYMLFRTKGIQWIRRPQGTVFHPKALVFTPRHWFLPQVPDSNNEEWGNGMVWGCVSRLRMGPHRLIQGITDKFQYEDILENTMRPYARNSLGRGFILQQDNDLKYRSKYIQNWFSRSHVTLLD
ncbi:Transposable element Tcb1 transposase [Araneus ventricosus]|uniref:Transposable element Tcb1 transposase n=1 Tax=Araneus ventricosus TaxID=182803 RepID=A0A4Y2C5X5_ARAVE|nr:Transposable element Tcb1 transposase [Araneus ventricosus]